MQTMQQRRQLRLITDANRTSRAPDYAQAPRTFISGGPPDIVSDSAYDERSTRRFPKETRTLFVIVAGTFAVWAVVLALLVNFWPGPT